MSPSSPQPPASARNAVWVIWAGAVTSVLGILLLFTQTQAIREQAESSYVYDVDEVVNVALAFGVVFGLIGTGLWVWMAIMNAKGHNWARITATVFGGIQIAAQAITLALVGGGVGFGATVNGEAVNPIPQSILGVCALGIAIAGIVLMWQSSSSKWYDAMGRVRQAARMQQMQQVQQAPVQVYPPNQV